MSMALFSQLIIHLYSNFEAAFDKRIIQLSDYENPITVMPEREQVDEDLVGIFDAFEAIATANSAGVEKYKNISQSLLQKGRTDIKSYREDYLIGGNFLHAKMPLFPKRVNVLVGLYNSVPKHSRPLSVNYMSNSLLGYLDNSTAIPRKITVSNHPLPFTMTVS